MEPRTWHSADAMDPRTWHAGSGMDPRIFQIATLTCLLAYGMAFLGFPVGLEELIVILGSTLMAQSTLAPPVGPKGAKGFDPKSALITGLSLVILLRAGEPWVLAAAGVLAIASKRLFRVGGKHVWNPSALAIAAAVVVTGQAWLSPGQWGSAAWFAFLIAGVGGLVVFRAERSDVTWAFAGFWCLLVLGRSAWLGEPLAVPLHRLQDGGLLLFTFFMISDPKSTPDSRVGRISFAGVVALTAFALKFGWHIHAGLVFALVICAPIVPILDRWLPGRRYAWPAHGAGTEPSEPVEQGVLHDPSHPNLGVPGPDGPRREPGMVRI